MTAGMVGFGALLWMRHRLTERARASEPVPAQNPRRVGRYLLLITGFSALVVALIVGERWYEGKPIALLSVAMPFAGLAWLLAIARKTQQMPPSAPESAATADRPSPRPPKRDSLAAPLANQGNSSSNRHASA